MLAEQQISDKHGLRISKMVSFASLPFLDKQIYTSEANAIIFLAPISAFDQVLAEVRTCICVFLTANASPRSGRQSQSLRRLSITLEISGFK